MSAARAAELDEVRRLLTRNPGGAVQRLRILAQESQPHAQLLLGQLLINGIGAIADPHEAFQWFLAAAHARVPMAMNMVGRCHENGLGTPVDYAAAARWYYRAATYECDWAIYNYAHLLANGRGVPKDRAAAFLWFKLAASRGHARAMAFLGQFYENGWETPVNRHTATGWYQRSAEGGDYRGQCSYASILAERGQIDESLHWVRLARSTAPSRYLSQLRIGLQASPHAVLRAYADTLPEGSTTLQQGSPSSSKAVAAASTRHSSIRSLAR
jgi:hypothetical protein